MNFKIRWHGGLIQAWFLTLFTILLMPLLITVSPAARAEVGPWQAIPMGSLRLLSSGTAEGDTALGLEVRLEPGWKIYWAYAGPVGQPTTFRMAEGSAASSLHFFYPWPERSQVQGYPSYSYQDQVLFPGIAMGPGQGGRLEVGLSICSPTQCIPHRAALALPSLPPSEDPRVLLKVGNAFEALPRPVAEPSNIEVLAAQQVLRLPRQADDFLLAADEAAARAGFFLQAVEGGPGGADTRARYEIGDPGADMSFLKTARVFAKTAEGAWVFDLRDARPYAALGRALGLSEELGIPDAETLSSETLSSETLGAETLSAGALGVQTLSVLRAALLMFVGGLLLNLMPCVLPILFLKMQAVLTAAGRQDAAATTALRGAFAWTGAGIVLTFLALGGALALAQQATGLQLTLGIWMQFPLTATILTALLVLLIANVFGWFNFRLPTAFVSLGWGRQDALGHFLAGVVAALLGGACSGVLLAAALLLAFAQPPPILAGLVTLMGVGLALPYILVAGVPAVARLIPKPGRWLGWFKPLTALGLAVTLGYLVLILSRQVAVPALAGLMVIAATALCLFYLRRGGSAFALLVLAALVIPQFPRPVDLAESARDYGAEIAATVEAGQLVLVDVTAYWCATCQTNKLWVLNSDETQTLLADMQIELLTLNADVMAENVSQFLAEQGRASLPFNSLFSPKYPKGEILPTILTKSAVREAVNRAL